MSEPEALERVVEISKFVSCKIQIAILFGLSNPLVPRLNDPQVADAWQISGGLRGRGF
jgi:hypothetical protein